MSANSNLYDLHSGSTLSPHIVMNIIQNEHPYNNVHTVRDLLKVVLRLQKNKEESMADYIIDMGTLEHLSFVAARKGHSQPLMIMWDYIQEVRNAGNPSYQPTQALYENVAQAFASSSRKEDQLLFGALATMEEQGYRPSYIFLRGVSQAMRTRSTVGRLEHASFMLQKSHNAPRYEDSDEIRIRVTSSALNVLISGYADLGLVDKAYRTFDLFDECDCKPDEHTFAFMVEAVAMNLTTAVPPRGNHVNEWVASQEEAADILVGEARQRGFHANRPLAHSYVEILCATKSLEKAKHFLIDMVLDADENGERAAIDLKTFSLLAMNYGLSADLEGADEIVQLCCTAGYAEGLPRHVTDRIERIRATHSV